MSSRSYLQTYLLRNLWCDCAQGSFSRFPCLCLSLPCLWLGMNSGTFMAFMAFRLGTTVAILAKEASIVTSNKFQPFVPDGMTFYQLGSKAILKTKNTSSTWERKYIGVENLWTLIKLFTIPFQIRSFSFWQLSSQIFVTAWRAFWAQWKGEGWEGTWWALVGDSGDLWTLENCVGGTPTQGRSRSMLCSVFELGIQLRSHNI